jgi:hypothetical protein
VAAVWSEQASGAVTKALLTRTVKAVGLMAAGQTVTAGLLSTKVPALTDAVLRATAAPKWKAAAVLLSLAGLALGGGMLAHHALPSHPHMPEEPAQPASRPDKPEQPPETGNGNGRDPDPKQYGTPAGAKDFVTKYLREHPIFPEVTRGQWEAEISRT